MLGIAGWSGARLSRAGVSVRRTPPGGGREPVRERDDKAAELIRLFDDERTVARGEHGRQPVELFLPQFGAEPGVCLLLCSCWGRQFLQGRYAGGQPVTDLLCRPLDPQAHAMAVRGRGEPRQDALCRIDFWGRLERAGQRPGVGDAVEPEGPVLADPGIRTCDVPAA